MKRVSLPSGPDSTRAMMRSKWRQLGGVVDLLETPLLAARRGRREALGRGLLQGLDVTTQRGIGGEAKDEIDAIGGTPVEHLGAV